MAHRGTATATAELLLQLRRLALGGEIHVLWNADEYRQVHLIEPGQIRVGGIDIRRRTLAAASSGEIHWRAQQRQRSHPRTMATPVLVVRQVAHHLQTAATAANEQQTLRVTTALGDMRLKVADQRRHIPWTARPGRVIVTPAH